MSFIWQNDDIRAWPNQQTLARETAGRLLRELVAVGLVGVKRNGLGKSSDIYLYDLDLSLLQVEEDDAGDCPATGLMRSHGGTPDECA